MENKYKIHQSFLKWLVTFVVMLFVFGICYFNKNAIPSLMFEACMWIAVLGIGLGLIVMLGTCILLLCQYLAQK